MWQRELENINRASLVKSPVITAMPSAEKNKDIVGEIAVKIADIEQILKGKLQEIKLQEERILKYIHSIDDSMIRQIIYYRDVKLLSWRQVALKIGGGNTGDSIRMAYYRFLGKSKEQ